MIKKSIILFTFSFIFLAFTIYSQNNCSIKIKTLPSYEYNYQGNTLSHPRNLPDQSAVYLYYVDINGRKLLSDFNVITNGKLQTQKFTVQIIGNPRMLKFYAIYRMINAYAEIKDYNIFDDDNRIEMLASFDSTTNTISIEFPVINKTTDPAFCLAMHSYYVLSKYRSSSPINLYSDNYRNFVVINTDDSEMYPNYNPENKEITLPIHKEFSYSDTTVKHEYGHHIYHSIFSIKPWQYTDGYDVFRSCDEQTAVNEAFSNLLEATEPFIDNVNDYPSDFGIALSKNGLAADLFNIYYNNSWINDNLCTRSGESTIFNVLLALLKLTENSGGSPKRVLDIYKKAKPLQFQSIWKAITSAEKQANTNIKLKNNNLNYKQFIEAIGIVYNRGMVILVSGVSNNNQSPALFEWGGKVYQKYLLLKDNPNIPDKSKVNIPIFPLEIAFQLKSASTFDLMLSSSAQSYSGLKIEGGSANGTPVSSEMESSKSFEFQICKIHDSSMIKGIRSFVCGGTMLYVGVSRKTLTSFYSTYWTSANSWTTIKINANGKTDSIKLKYNEVYAVRAISTDMNGITDSFLPEYNESFKQMANLFMTNTLFFFQTPANKTTAPKLTPAARPSNLIKGSNSNRIKGSSAVNPNYVKDGSEMVTAGVTITLPGISDIKDAKNIIDTEFIFRDFYKGKYENLTPEIEKGEEEGQYIVKSEFNPSGNGEHKITAQFGELKEDEIEDAKASGTYAELIYENDLITPSVSDTFKKTENSATIYGNITENESGVGLLNKSDVTDKNGNYLGANIDYDIQLAGSPEITYNSQFLSKYLEIPVAYRKPCYNFIPSTFYDPLTGNFQLGTFEAYAPMIAKIKYKVTDKAGNESVQSVSLNFMNIGFDPNKTDIHDKYGLCGGSINCSAWEILPEVLSKNSNDYSISPATCSKQDIVLLNNKPIIESINFEKVSATSNDTIDLLGGNKLAFKYSDPDGSGDLGIDAANCSVTCGLTGELPRDFSGHGGTYTHEFTLNDDLLQGLEGEFEVIVKITDKIGAEGTESKKFHLNMGAPEIKCDEEIAEASTNTEDEDTSKLLQGVISDRGTDTEDLIIIVKSFAIDNTRLRKSKTEKVFETNPANLKCQLDDQVSSGGGVITVGPGYPSLEKKSGANKSLFNYDSSTGGFSYDIGNYDANKIETEITVFDKNCNKTVKTIITDLEKNTATIVGSESSENSVKPSINPPEITVKQYSNDQLKASGIISDSDTEQKLIAVTVSTLKDSLAARTAAKRFIPLNRWNSLNPFNLPSAKAPFTVRDGSIVFRILSPVSITIILPSGLPIGQLRIKSVVMFSTWLIIFLTLVPCRIRRPLRRQPRLPRMNPLEEAKYI